MKIDGPCVIRLQGYSTTFLRLLWHGKLWGNWQSAKAVDVLLQGGY